MPKKKRTNPVVFTAETMNILMAGILLALSVLVIFTERGSSVAGWYLEKLGMDFYGKYYQYIFSFVPLVLGVMILMRRASWTYGRAIGILLSWVALTSLVGFIEGYRVGVFDIHYVLVQYFDTIPALIFTLTLLGLSLWMALRISYRTILRNVHEKFVVPSLSWLKDVATFSSKDDITIQKSDAYSQRVSALEDKLSRIAKKKEEEEKKRWFTEKLPSFLKEKNSAPSLLEKITQKVEIKNTKGSTWKEDHERKNVHFGSWDFPSVKLLNEIKHVNVVSDTEIEENSLIIQKTFLQFGIEVEVVDEAVGPTVVQYRILPAEGVKLSKIMALKDNLTLALKAKSIRIQAPIPGMGLVGIEVPNVKRDTIGIREILSDTVFAHHKSRLALAIGKDINGDFIVGDLANMPHLLIAWQTGSGKSVGMNGFLLSLLFKNTPNDLRLIMVDPKQVELGIYDGIPHLLTPVINSPDKALNALRWAVGEMERRYTTFKPLNVRNLQEYNTKVEEKMKLPVIVIVIDELADLMMSGNKKETENAITRIAQKARAVGMHLILATQRPSVNVITGTIKANIPSRIAFTVASQVDSRTILDNMGAEDLLGRGDMLYFPTGAMAQTRLQWVLVETDEVERVVRHIRLTIDPAMLEDLYDASIIEWEKWNWEWSSSLGWWKGWSDEDPKIIEEAIELVRSSGKCSTSMFQRHLKLGYGRAARVVDVLEEMGIVWPADGSRPRDVIG